MFGVYCTAHPHVTILCNDFTPQVTLTRPAEFDVDAVQPSREQQCVDGVELVEHDQPAVRALLESGVNGRPVVAARTGLRDSARQARRVGGIRKRESYKGATEMHL